MSIWQYDLLYKLGEGSFGNIRLGRHRINDRLVAIKIESKANEIRILKREAQIYQLLSHTLGVPPLKWFGSDDTHHYMAIGLLGASVKQHAAAHFAAGMPLPRVVQIGLRMTDLVQNLHVHHLLHRDIKPDNFLFPDADPPTDDPAQIHIIDFGLCAPYSDEIAQSRATGLIGSMNYASIASHNRTELGRRDDLESVGYILINLARGGLPWGNDSNENLVRAKKQRVRDLGDELVPAPIAHMLQYTATLQHDSPPNYDLVREMLNPEPDEPTLEM